MNGNGTGWTRIIGCLIFIGHFPQTNPIISGSFAKKTCNLRHPMGLLHPVHTHSLMSPQLQRVAACCSVLQCVLQDINDGASCTRRYVFRPKHTYGWVMVHVRFLMSPQPQYFVVCCSLCCSEYLMAQALRGLTFPTKCVAVYVAVSTWWRGLYVVLHFLSHDTHVMEFWHTYRVA